MTSVEEREQAIREQDRRISLAIAAYNAVWQSWSGLDAHNVDECRNVAMTAALAAADSK